MKRLHITALTGHGMTTEYRALETPHMGSAPWVSEEDALAAEAVDRALDAMEAKMRDLGEKTLAWRSEINEAGQSCLRETVKAGIAAALAQEDEDDRA